MKRRLLALLLVTVMLGLTACDAPAETGAPTGEIFIYGEEHANADCLDRELAVWQTCYGQGMRHLFIEMGAGSTLLLNRWMTAEDDAYWDMVYGACEGTLFHAATVADFYHQIKETCPDTVCHLRRKGAPASGGRGKDRHRCVPRGGAEHQAGRHVLSARRRR